MVNTYTRKTFLIMNNSNIIHKKNYPFLESVKSKKYRYFLCNRCQERILFFLNIVGVIHNQKSLTGVCIHHIYTYTYIHVMSVLGDELVAHPTRLLCSSTGFESSLSSLTVNSIISQMGCHNEWHNTMGCRGANNIRKFLNISSLKFESWSESS